MGNGGDAGAIQNSSRAADAGLSNSSRADGGNTASVPCPGKVTVTIKLNPPVACPGHPLPISAVGSPSGGTYAWTVSQAELVDGSGDPTSISDAVNLRSFQPDNTTGSIPEIIATVGVTYTHPNGTAQDSKTVKIHKIDFAVANATPSVTNLLGNEDEVQVSIESQDPNSPTVNVDPKVTIKIDASCPRAADCAKNHRAGWIQDVTALDKGLTWRHRMTTASYKVGPPIRDAVAGAEFPFYSDPIPFSLDIEASSDAKTINHSDSPGWGGLWSDPKAADESVDNSLQEVRFQQSFTAWLVVQNVEWSQHDMMGSLAFQKNFTWSVNHTVKVDTTKPTGKKCTPHSSTPGLGNVGGGKGSATPSLTDLAANDATIMTSTSTDPPAPPSANKRKKR